LKSIKKPKSDGYNHGIDDTPMCTEEDSAKYRSIIGCCIWIMALGRYDIAYDTSSLSRFNMSPKEGHLKVAKRILAYLKLFPKGIVIVSTAYTTYSINPIDDHSNWKDFYLDAEEDIPNNLP
jgi:hypothetical protein